MSMLVLNIKKGNTLYIIVSLLIIKDQIKVELTYGTPNIVCPFGWVHYNR